MIFWMGSGIHSTCQEYVRITCLYFIAVSIYCHFCRKGATCEEQSISAICHCAPGFYVEDCGEYTNNSKQLN